MASHRFKVGQSVFALVPGIPSGPYTIVRLLPPIGRDPHYQGKSADGVVRAFLESHIEAVPVTSDAPEVTPRVPAAPRIRKVGRR